jgi:hypothetical protein
MAVAERSFVEEVKKLRLGKGEVFSGEGIAVTKALLEAGVAYVAGYQGAPISHLMEVLADAHGILADHGIRFENSASEATAAVLAAINPQLAPEAARCQRLVKGYSDTHARGLRNYETLMSAVDRHRRSLAPTTLKELRDGALADEHGHRLNECLNRLALKA